MEARVGRGAPHQFHGVPVELGGGRGVLWDPNQWSWDGNLFVATPVTANADGRNKQILEAPSDEAFDLNSPSSSSGDAEVGVAAAAKRRRVVVVGEDGEGVEGRDSLALNLGGRAFPVWGEHVNGDASDGRRGRAQAGSSSRGVCQVEGCAADLSSAKDYHRRHKVCEMHAKATTAIVGNAVQRFCQQCSRFHLLQEFDEGKRSCRQRLSDHNKRRRKNHQETNVGEPFPTCEQSNNYLLPSLLRILSNLQSNNNEELKHHNLLFNFLSSLASLARSVDTGKLSALLQVFQDQQNIGNTSGTAFVEGRPENPTCHVARESCKPLGEDVTQDHMTGAANGISCAAEPILEMPQNIDAPQHSPESTVWRVEPALEKSGIKNFDLNDAYDDGACHLEDTMIVAKLKNSANGSLNPLLLQRRYLSSQIRTNGNSNSSSPESLISSNGEVQSWTDKIVFKLFGKDPNDFPGDLRKQIFNWLSSTPTDAESYIRPGCIILTIYLRLSDFTWEELSCNLSFHMRRLLHLDVDEFWRKGWLYVRLQHQMALINNGQLILDAPFLPDSDSQCKILSISPVAVCISGECTFRVKGLNLSGTAIRLLCALEGKYLVEEATHVLLDDETADAHDQHQFLKFSCSTPSICGRGFIEIEDHGLGGAFFPFIVAEKDVCAEICTLERTIDVDLSQYESEEKFAAMKARERALDFLHEVGWLLQRCQLTSVKVDEDSCTGSFPVSRFKCLIEFSIEHEWHAVVTNLLRIFFGGSVDIGSHSVESALKEMALLHYAVRRNSRPMVELLLRYVPEKSPGMSRSQNLQDAVPGSFCFIPDMPDCCNETPLHIAASRDGAEDVLDALTNDPRQVGITAWKTVHNSNGSTPEDCASASCHESYLHLVEKKINGKSNVGHVIVDVRKELPGTACGTQKKIDDMMVFQVDKKSSRRHCKVCSQQQLAFISRSNSSLLYRPAMLSLVGIAAVCVCVGLLLKGPPDVKFIFGPFRWDNLNYGWI